MNKELKYIFDINKIISFLLEKFKFFKRKKSVNIKNIKPLSKAIKNIGEFGIFVFENSSDVDKSYVIREPP